MKRICLLALLLALNGARAQDPAVEERLNKLDGYVKDLIAAQADLQKRIGALAEELERLRNATKHNGVAATQEDLKRLADAVQEVDRKRIEDYEKIHNELKDLAKALAAPAPAGRPSGGSKSKPVRPAPPATDEPPAEKGYEYVVQPGDTLSVIVQAYREKGIKVTVEQIVKANPGLKPDLLRPGQKLFIPAPPK